MNTIKLTCNDGNTQTYVFNRIMIENDVIEIVDVNNNRTVIDLRDIDEKEWEIEEVLIK